MRARNLPCFDSRRASERSLETAQIAAYLSPSAFFVLALCRPLPYGISLTRRGIGQALATGALESATGPLHVIYAQANAIAIAEIEFCEIAVQMLFAAMLVDADHATLEDGEVAFNGVGVNGVSVGIAHVFVSRVHHGFVARKFPAGFAIPASFIGHERAFAIDVGAQDRTKLSNGHAFNVETTNGPAALDKSEDRIFLSPAAA